nr:ribonuclease H-like domain-containing protein [Tanacetum cinerariifolium]
MELEIAQTGTTAKVQDYALWDVIENGNSFNLVAQTIKGTSSIIIPGLVTTGEKTQKKNVVKARNLDIISFDDLYNNFKIVGQEVKRTTRSSSISSSQTMVFVSTHSTSITDDVNTAYEVSTASTQVSTASTQKTGKKITINGSDTAGYDKFKVECYNCHKMGHFTRKYRGTRNHDSRCRNQESSRRIVNVEETSSKAMVAIDGVGFDWSYMAEDEVPTNMAFMASLDSESLDKLIGSHITDKSKKGLGYVSYNAVPPPHTGRFSPPKLDLSHTGLPEFVEPSVESYEVKSSKVVTKAFCLEKSKTVRESNDEPLIKECESEREDEVESPLRIERKTIKPSVGNVEVVKPNQQEKPTRKPIKYAKMSFDHLQAGCNYHQRESMGHPQKELEDEGYVDSGCSRHMTGNMSYLIDFKEFDEGYVAFEGGAKGEKITNVLQMCDKKNNVLFTNTECFVLSPNFKLGDESQVLLKVPRKNNMYSVDIKNIVPKESLTCLVAKATLDESMLWHRRLGHVNFKTINKLVKENLVRGLPSKRFENNQTCVACLKGKQHKASSTKDETSGILKSFITQIENLVDKKLKIIRCDNGTEFKNRVMHEFCEKKGIKREYSIAKTPQQNGISERRNRTLIEAARTMVLVIKPHNKTLYELFRGRTHALSFLRPFGYHVTILNTIDHLGKFEGKADDGFFVGYFMNSKDFRVYNIRTRKVEENLHIEFLENKPIIASTKASIGAGQSSMETGPSQDYILMPLWNDGSLFDFSSKNSGDDGPPPSSDVGKKDDEGPSKESGIDDQEGPEYENSTKDINTAGPSINTASINVNTGSLNINTVSLTANTVRSSGATYDDFFSTEADMRSLDKIKMDVKSAFLYERIKEEVYVCQPLGFEDSNYPDKVYKVVKALYGLHQAPRAGLQVKQKRDGIFISQDKYVAEISRKFGVTDVKPTSTSMDTEKALLKDSDGDDVGVYLYRFQVTPKVSHLHAVKGIFSDYARESLDRKSIIGGCQFLGCRLISWQYKKQTAVATSTTIAEIWQLLVVVVKIRVFLEYSCTGLRTVATGEMGFQVRTKREKDKIETKRDKTGSVAKPRKEIALFPSMLAQEQTSQGEGPTSPVETQHTPTVIESSPQLQTVSITCRRKSKQEYKTKLLYNEAFLKLIDRVKKLEKRIKSKRRSAVIVSSKDEEEDLDVEEASKQGRKIAQIDQDKGITLLLKMLQLLRRSTASPTRTVDVSADDITLAETLMSLDEEVSQRLHEEEQAKFKKEQEMLAREREANPSADDIKLWRLVKENFISTEPTDEKERALWNSILSYDHHEGRVFDIDLIPFGHGSFDVIIGMDWLSNHKVEIICYEKVVRIPLPDDKVLRVLGERPEEKARLLMSAKASDKKQEEIVFVRDFPEVFSDDLSRLPPLWKIEFRIELNPRAIPIAKSAYRLAPFELEELSRQLKELQHKGFIRSSSSPWGALVLFVKKKDSSFRMWIDYRELNKLWNLKGS